MKREKHAASAHLQPSPAIHSRAEEKKVEERLAISPSVVYETIRREGEEGFQRTSAALGWSALAAGFCWPAQSAGLFPGEIKRLAAERREPCLGRHSARLVCLSSPPRRPK